MYKISLFLSVFLTSTIISFSQAKWPFAATSPTQKIIQSFGSSNVEISYSRPSVKGRVVFGEVVPFDKLWRTGANAATTVYFGDEALINNTKVPAGKYGLVTIPGKTEWTIIISKDTTVNGEDKYKQENDLVRIKTKSVALGSKVETFTFDINNIKPNEAQISLRWDKTEVSFKFSIDLDSKVLKHIDEQMATASEKDKPYYNAAGYYLDNNKDLNKALEFVNKAIESNKDAFYMYYTKAKIQNKLGDKKGALESANVSIEKAKAAKNDDFVRNNEKLIKEINKK
ncbi:MAG: DUF2911 domain-containing protein [Opitutaceae bacterium]|nr:DUF2911 domain-containing protein [Cytophagales bacterium]